MRFGVFSVADSYLVPPGEPERDPARGVVDLALGAEHAGFDHFWVGEHHFHRSGAVPSPPVVLAAIAALTRRIRIGPLVSVLPFHESLQLAEEYALLDRLSNGRVELGVGSGYVGSEFRGFGLDAESRSARFNETLPMVLRLLRGERIRSRPAAEPVAINVRPIQTPRPPVWVAAGRRSSIEGVGRAGHGVALIPYATLGRIDELTDAVRAYRQALPHGVAPRVLVAFHVGVGDRPATLRRLQRFLDSRPDPEDPRLSAYRSAHPNSTSAEFLTTMGLTLIGSSRELRERIRWCEEIGVTDLVGMVDFGGAGPLDSLHSMQAFADLVGRGPAPGAAPLSGREWWSGDVTITSALSPAVAPPIPH